MLKVKRAHIVIVIASVCLIYCRLSVIVMIRPCCDILVLILTAFSSCCPNICILQVILKSQDTSSTCRIQTGSIRSALHDVPAMPGQVKRPFPNHPSVMIQVALIRVLKLTMVTSSMKAHFCGCCSPGLCVYHTR
jgi:hypothetical protein